MTEDKKKNQLVAQFLGLSSVIKKQKVLAMLERIKDKNETFASLYTELSLEKRAVSDSILVAIYTGILQVAAYLREQATGVALDHLHATQHMLLSLREKEQQQKAQEGDEEELLSLL